MFASGSTGTTLSAGEAFSRLMLLGVQLVRGDVLNMSMGIPVPSAGTTVMMPVEVQRVIVSALRMLTFRGITCMIAAGNSTLNLDNPPFPFTNSGSIMVGGIEPTNAPATTFKRHPISNFGARVDCCSWASEVESLTFQSPPNPTAKLYTGADGGTSLASAIVAGVVAAMQGRSLVSAGKPLTPLEVLTLLRDPAMGSDVVPGGLVGLQPDLAAIIPTL